jgi:glutathione peroxidase
MLRIATLSLLITMAIGIYDFKVPGLDGGSIDLSKYKGKKILIVNTASKCGYTPQYEELETLYKTYQSKLVIIGFPANNFGGQEPAPVLRSANFAKRIMVLLFLWQKKYL